MTLGASIFLMALGAILTFAIDDKKIGGVDLGTIGIILMIAGALGAVLGGVLYGRGRATRATTRRTVVDGQAPPREEIVENEIR